MALIPPGLTRCSASGYYLVRATLLDGRPPLGVNRGARRRQISYESIHLDLGVLPTHPPVGPIGSGRNSDSAEEDTLRDKTGLWAISIINRWCAADLEAVSKRDMRYTGRT